LESFQFYKFATAPQNTDTLAVYTAGTLVLVNGLTDLAGNPLPNPFTVLQAGGHLAFGFLPPEGVAVDVVWVEQSRHIARNLNRDLAPELAAAIASAIANKANKLVELTLDSAVWENAVANHDQSFATLAEMEATYPAGLPNGIYRVVAHEGEDGTTWYVWAVNTTYFWCAAANVGAAYWTKANPYVLGSCGEDVLHLTPSTFPIYLRLPFTGLTKKLRIEVADGTCMNYLAIYSFDGVNDSYVNNIYITNHSDSGWTGTTPTGAVKSTTISDVVGRFVELSPVGTDTNGYHTHLLTATNNTSLYSNTNYTSAWDGENVSHLGGWGNAPELVDLKHPVRYSVASAESSWLNDMVSGTFWQAESPLTFRPTTTRTTDGGLAVNSNIGIPGLGFSTEAVTFYVALNSSNQGIPIRFLETAGLPLLINLKACPCLGLGDYTTVAALAEIVAAGYYKKGTSYYLAVDASEFVTIMYTVGGCIVHIQNRLEYMRGLLSWTKVDKTSAVASDIGAASDDHNHSGVYDPSGTAAAEVGSHASGAQHGTTAGEQTAISTAYDHSQAAHAPSGAEANAASASQAEAEAGTEAANRSWSPVRIWQAITKWGTLATSIFKGIMGGGYKETLYSVTTNGNVTIDLANGNVQRFILDAARQFTMPADPGAYAQSFVLIIECATHTPTWNTSPAIEWLTSDGAPPTLATAANLVNVLPFLWDDADSRWLGLPPAKETA